MRKLAATIAPDQRLGRGRGLTRTEAAGFGEALDCDLSPVRIHAGPYAAALAEAHRAVAFTYGTHIVLGRQAAAAPPARREAILAHELIHVIQQSAPAVPRHASLWGQPRAPPVAPVQRCPLRPQNIDLVPDFIEDGARAVGGAISDAGTAVYEGASYVGGTVVDGASYVASEAADFVVEVGGVVLEGAEAVIDYVAPDLLGFLRGDFLSDLGEMFCDGLDSLVGTLLDPLSEIDIMAGLESTFTGIAQGIRGLYGALGGAARATVGFLLRPFIWLIEHFGDDIIGAIQWLSDGVSGIFTALWDNIAAPVLDFLGSVGGAIWEGFQAIAGWVWGLCLSVKNAAEWAFDWLLDQFGLTWEGEGGVADWIATKAQEAWDAFLELIEPIKTPLMVVGGILLLLSPLGPILVLSQVLPPLWEKIVWIASNWQDLGVVVWARQLLHDDILPGIIGAVDFVRSAFTSAAGWLAGLVASVARGMADVVSAFGSNGCLNSVTRVLDHIADQFTRLQSWAESGFAGLSEAVSAFFDALRAIFQPILDFLVRFLIVAANPPLLPLAITAAIWLLLPDEFKPAVINFILGLLIGLAGLLAVAFAMAGPMVFVLQAATIAFMRHLRSGAGVTDQIRIDASNKVANIMAGGGPQFVAGYAVGLLRGLIDGIIDPFKLLFMLFELVMAAYRVLGRVLAPYVQQLAPEAVTAGLADYSAALAIPDQAARRTPSAEATHAPARAPPAGPETVTSTLSGGTLAPTAGEAASATPSAEAETGTEAGEAAPASEDVATAEAVLGTQSEGEGGDDLSFAEGGATDAEIIAGLSPATISEIGGSAPEGLSAETLETSMREEVESEGASVSGLASLLGGAWDFLMQQAGRLGTYLARKLLEFLALGDYALGNKLGWLAGMILLEVLITYFTAGGYTVIKQGASIGSRLLAYLLRFLDIGGEILGVLGRALAPLRGPLTRGFGAAQSFLSRFNFLRGILGRIDDLIRRLFRFGDEAAAASARAAPAPRAPELPTRAPDIPTRAPEVPTRAPDAPAPTRAATAQADEAGERAAREILDDPPTRPASEAAEELPDGAMRAVDEPGVPRVRDDAAKAAQIGEAMVAARSIAETNDAIDAPMPATLGLLIALKRRYRWIDTFRAELRGPGVYRILMVASSHNITEDYTSGEAPGYSFEFEGREIEVIPMRGPRQGGPKPDLSVGPDLPRRRPRRRRRPDHSDKPPAQTPGQRHINDVQIEENATWNPNRYPDLDQNGLPPFDGANTMGRLDCDAGVQHVKSGRGQPGQALGDDPGMPAGSAAFTHAEGHAASIMRQTGAREGTLWINHPDGPCSFCDKVIENMLPEGARLTVLWRRGGGGFGAMGFRGNSI